MLLLQRFLGPVLPGIVKLHKTIVFSVALAVLCTHVHGCNIFIGHVGDGRRQNVELAKKGRGRGVKSGREYNDDWAWK